MNHSNILDDSQLYSVRIEVYELNRRDNIPLIAVWEYPIIYFDHLPVYRLAKVLRLIKVNPCSGHSCHKNEECHRLINNPSEHICLCKPNFHGENCSFEDKQCLHNYCGPGSLCKSDYLRPLRGYLFPYCICTSNRYGDRCDIEHDMCQTNPCFNGGSCFPTSKADQIICLCLKQFYGDRCQWKKSHLHLYMQGNVRYSGAVIQIFDLNFTSLDLILVHQEVHKILPSVINYNHYRKTVPNLVLGKLYSSFKDLSVNFYLLSLVMNAEHFLGRTEFSEVNRCQHLREISTDNISMKFSSPIGYHQICRMNDRFLCFRDDVYLCICVDEGKRVECFLYNDQLDQCSHCWSGGRCLQGDPIRSNDFLCLCPRCHSGRQCQFDSQSMMFTFDQLFFTDLTSPTTKQKTVDEGYGTMCVIQVPNNFQSMWIFLHHFVFAFHLLIPILINICCTFIIIIVVINMKINVREQTQFHSNNIRGGGDVFRDLLNENKELITRPVISLLPNIFSLLILPSFIIAFSLRCHNLETSPLRYLLIVFTAIAFIPQIMTFVLYIYPSTFYRNQWHATKISKWLNTFRRHS